MRECAFSRKEHIAAKSEGESEAANKSVISMTAYEY
jgi:hypothetical protein